MTKICVVVALAGLASAANAALVTNRAAIVGDSIDWGQFGGSFTPVANGSAGLTTNSVPFTLNGPSNLERRDQGAGWGGNFGPGHRLMWTANTPGAMTITFGVDVVGVGAQIQRDAYNGFIGHISVYDSANTLLETYSVGGNSTGAGDDSAIFIGIKRAQGDIRSVVFDVDNGREDFAVNEVAVTPTPGSLALLGAGGLLAARRRRKA